MQLGTGQSGQDGSIGGTSGVTNNATLVYNIAGTQSAGYPIGGSGSLAMVGTGTLTLAQSNGYSGGTFQQNGLLQLGNAAALGTGALAANGGTLDLAGNSILVSSFSGAAGTVTNNGGSPATLTVNQSGATTFSGTLQNGAGTLALFKTGGGSLALFGTNTYSGATTVNAGVLYIDGALTASPVTIQGGTLKVNGPVAGNVTMSAGAIDSDLPTMTLSGSLAVTGSSIWRAVGTMAGGATVQAGAFSIDDGATLTTPALNVVGGSIVGVSHASVLNGSLNYTSSSNSTFIGQITGAGSSVTLNSAAAMLTLSGSNTCAGGTTVNNGMLVVADGPNTSTAFSALGTGVLTLNGGTLAAGPAGGSVAGLVQAGSAAHTIAPGAALASGYGTLNLNGGLSANASTTLAFNVYNAPQISGGIYVGDLINLNGSSLTVSGGSIAFVGASPTTLGDYRLIANLGVSSTNPTGFSLPPAPGGSNETYQLSTSVDPGNLDLVVASAATFSGSATWIATGGSAVWSNSGNWTDGTNHGIPGTSLSRTADTAAFNGTDSATSIILDVSPSLAALSFSGTNYTLSGSGTLTMNGGTAGATIAVAGGTQSIASAVQIAGGNLLVTASSSGLLAISGGVSDDGGRSLTLTGDGSGQLVLGGVNSYTGGTYVEQGTLIANDNGAIPDQSGLIVGAGGTFLFDPTLTGSALNAASLGRPLVGPASQVNPVPEPAALTLLAAAGIVAAAAAWRRKKGS